MKELVVLVYLEYFEHWRIDQLLNQVQLVLCLLLEQILVDAPEVQLHFQHFEIIFLLLVQNPIVSDEVDHQVECKRVTIDKVAIIFHLQGVSSGKHGLQGAALNAAERGLPD